MVQNEVLCDKCGKGMLPVPRIFSEDEILPLMGKSVIVKTMVDGNSSYYYGRLVIYGSCNTYLMSFGEDVRINSANIVSISESITRTS